MNQQITKYRIQVLNQNREFMCAADKSLLIGMERDQQNCIDVGCRGGGCGVCLIRVIEGTYSSKRMSKAHVSEEDKEKGIVLACRIQPESDLKVEVVETACSQEKTN